MTVFSPGVCVTMNLYGWSQESHCHSTGKTTQKNPKPKNFTH